MKFSQFMLLCSLPVVAGRRLQGTIGSIFNPGSEIIPNPVLTPTTDSASKIPTKPPEGQSKHPTKPPEGQSKHPTKPPDGNGTPTTGGGGPIYGDRTEVPSFAPSESCNLECKVDTDCPQVCKQDYPFNGVGTCVSGDISRRPTFALTEKPTFGPKECPCDNPKTIPTKCEVGILIDMMDIAVQSSVKNLGQWVRMSFHDAGTFDQTMPEGGANGCLLNDPSMSGITGPEENRHMDDGILSLISIKNDWHAHPQTCINVSSADMLQFAAFFAATRQSLVPESISSSATSTTAIQKRDTLKADFVWGRPDEANCLTAWTDNLPGFSNGAIPTDFPGRCVAAGTEIVEKMINRNGFTAEEANVLIGAHTMGMVRGTFLGKGFGPWVENGGDAFPGGPVFDNAYHDFLVNTIVANDIPTFAQLTGPPPGVFNMAPFTDVFGDWFMDTVSLNPQPVDIIHLDTDITLAFEPLAPAAHPDFSIKTHQYANNNTQFLKEFFQALDKMSKLGVTAPLFPATECTPCDLGAVLDTGVIISVIKNLGNATAFADQATAELQIFRTQTGVIERLTTPVLFTRKPTSSPTTSKPTSKPTTSNPTSMKPTTSKPTSSKPTSAKPVIIQTAKPQSLSTLKPTSAKPVTNKPQSVSTLKPTSAKPVTNKPQSVSTLKPSSAKPVIITETAKPVIIVQTAKPVIVQTAKPVSVITSPTAK